MRSAQSSPRQSHLRSVQRAGEGNRQSFTRPSQRANSMIRRERFLWECAGLFAATVTTAQATPPPESTASPKEEGGKKTCTADFVNGTKNPPAVKTCPHGATCTPYSCTLHSECSTTLHRLIYPGSKYDNKAGLAKADAELKRAVDFYAKYCIELKTSDVTLTAGQKKKLKSWYDGWIADVLPAVGGAAKLGLSTIPSGLCDDFRAMTRDLQASIIQGLKDALLVVFMDEYIGGSDLHDTLVSSCQEDVMQVGINWVDAGSPYILSHELIHLLGKPSSDTTGAVTWPHSSSCANALSHITRTNARQTEDLSGRYLDIAEYVEICTNGAAKLLKCNAIK
jgi:hypothetical protein